MKNDDNKKSGKLLSAPRFFYTDSVCLLLFSLLHCVCRAESSQYDGAATKGGRLIAVLSVLGQSGSKECILVIALLCRLTATKHASTVGIGKGGQSKSEDECYCQY